MSYDGNMLKRVTWQRVLEAGVLGVLGYMILWKGGKTLSALWVLAFLAVGLTIIQNLFYKSKTDGHVPRLVWWSGMGFILLTALSFIFSMARNYGLDEVLQTTSLVLLLFWTIRWSHRQPYFESRFMRTVSVVLVIACAVGVVVYTFQPVNRFVGTFFDYRFHTDYWPNAWAEAVLFLWPMLVWVFWGRKSAKNKVQPDWMKVCVLGFVFGCLLLSYSRGGFLTFSGQVVLMGILYRFFGRGRINWRRIMAISAASMVLAMVVFLGINHLRGRFYPVESVTRKITFSSDEGASSVSERVQFWRQAVSLIPEQPLLGFGPYSFRFVQPHLERSVLATSDHPHNVILKYAMERGIPAALMFMILIGTVFYLGLRSFIKSGKSAQLVLFIGIVGVLAHNMIDFNLQFQGISVPLWIGLGLFIKPVESKSRGNGLATRIFEVILAMGLLILAVSEGIFLFESFMARRAEAKGDVRSALQWYEMTNPALFPRDQWLARGVINLSLGNIPAAIRTTETYLKTNEQDARAWRLLGDIFLKAGTYDQAYTAYSRAYAFGRYNDIGITRGFVYVSAHSKQLGSMKKDVDQLLNEFGLAIQKNTHFIALSKNVEDLVSLCDLMSQLFPENHTEYRALARETVVFAREARGRYTARSAGVLW
jgi:O-antigen ligase